MSRHARDRAPAWKILLARVLLRLSTFPDDLKGAR